MSTLQSILTMMCACVSTLQSILTMMIGPLCEYSALKMVIAIPYCHDNDHALPVSEILITRKTGNV